MDSKRILGGTWEVTFLVIAVDFVGSDAGVLGLASGVDTFLLVDLHPLVAFEDERFVVATALASVQFQHSRGSVTIHLHIEFRELLHGIRIG